MSKVKLETYSKHSRQGEDVNGSNYSLSEKEWEEIKTHLEELNETIRRVREKQGIEEKSPNIQSRDRKFVPNGWVGSYPNGVEVVPDKLEPASYQSMLAESKGLIESFGLRTAEAALPFSPDVLKDAESLYLRYSESLIEITEALLSGRLPVDVKEKVHVSREVKGKPDFKKTLKQRAQKRPFTVSKSVSFDFDTLSNRLLYHFNTDLRRRLGSLERSFDMSDPTLQRRKSYHGDVTVEALPKQLTSRSIQDIALKPDEFAKLSQEATGRTAELADLWEAYRRQLTTDLNPSERYDTAIKPVSKVYEIWCLRQILEVLRSKLGHEVGSNPPGEFPKKFDFPNDVTLYYERSVANHSKYIKKLFRPKSGTHAGSPDYLLTVENDVRWVADAKFQYPSEIDLAGSQRFISYIIDYLPEPEKGKSTLLCIADSPYDKSDYLEGYRFRKLGLSPSLDTQKLLRKEITSVL